MAKRGQMTIRIQEIARKHIGRDITQEELRLIPYIQYESVNNQTLSIIGRNRKISDDEIKIIETWERDGYINNIYGVFTITKQFWDFMCEILFESYVVYTEGR